jgi:DNA-binding transcriptional MerR regulator
MHLMDIGEVSSKSGVKPSALRYYEEVGLISSVSRHGLRRQFPREVLLQLKLISMGKSAGFSLQEIAGMFGRNGMPDLPRDMFLRKAEEIDKRIVELTTMSKTLRHIANCSAPTHLECSSFRRLLSSADSGKRKHLS